MVLLHLLLGLLLAFLLWSITFIIGICVLLNLGGYGGNEPAEEPVDFLAATGCGIALLIFTLFLLAACHVFWAPTIGTAILLLIIGLVAVTVKRRSRRTLITSIRQTIVSNVSFGWILVMAACIGLSAPALLPYESADDTLYHFAEAINWANTGFLVVDPFIRFPLAQFNIELLFALFFAFKLGAYVQFVTWFFYALSATGIVSLSTRLLLNAGVDRVSKTLISVAGAAIFVAFPMALKYSVIGYIDVPAGAMLLAFVSALMLVQHDYRRYAIAAAIIGGSFAGIKLTFAPFAAFVVIVLLAIGVYRGATRRQLFLVALVSIVVASPWYVRNVVVAGDPIDPVFNLLIHHSDPFWAQGDYDFQKGDLRRSEPLFATPVWIFQNRDEASGGVSLSFCFLYLPFIVLVGLALNSEFRRRAKDLFLIDVILVFAIFEELLVSNRFPRYADHFYAIYCVFLAVCFWKFFNWLSTKAPSRIVPIARYGGPAFLLLLLIVPPGTREYDDFHNSYDHLYLGVTKQNAVYTLVSGYPEAQELSRLISASMSGTRVLDMGFESLSYYFRADKVISVGDYFGQGSYYIFTAAAKDGSLVKLLRTDDIGGVLMRRNDYLFSAKQREVFVEDLRRAGFIEISRPESEARDFVRSDVLRVAEQRGVKVEAAQMPSSDTINFVSVFDDGRIGHDAVTKFVPGGHTALILPALFKDEYSRALTIIGGYNISFNNIAVSNGSTLSFEVAKLFPFGGEAHSFVDLVDGAGKHRRIYDASLPKASLDGPIWQDVSIRVGDGNSKISLMFGATGGDWVAFVHPELSKARLTDALRAGAY